MLKTISMVALLPLCLISLNSNAQNLPENPTGILVKEKLKVEFKYGHSCMTQTRAATKEEALYTTSTCGAVKYQLSKKGKRFTIFEKNDSGEWFEWGAYTIAHSFKDQEMGDLRYTFLTDDGSRIIYVPKTPDGPLVMLDLYGEELIHFVYK